MEVMVKENVLRIVTVAPQGRFDVFSAPKIREQLEQLFADGVINFVVDLSETLFLDSAAMAVLVSVLKQSRQRQGDVKLVWPKMEAARRILMLTRFDRVFDIADSPEAAVKRF